MGGTRAAGMKLLALEIIVLNDGAPDGPVYDVISSASTIPTTVHSHSGNGTTGGGLEKVSLLGLSMESL